MTDNSKLVNENKVLFKAKCLIILAKFYDTELVEGEREGEFGWSDKRNHAYYILCLIV